MPTPKQASEQAAAANEQAAAEAEARREAGNTRDVVGVDTPAQVEDVVQVRRDKVNEDWDVLLSTILQRWDLIPKNTWDRRRGTFDEVVEQVVEQYKVDREEAERQVDYWLSHQYRAD